MSLFPIEFQGRLVVQYRRTHSEPWTEPRVATLDDILSALREFSSTDQTTVAEVVLDRYLTPAQILDRVRALWPEYRIAIAKAVGILPEDVAERLLAVEGLLDALGDAQLAIDRFRAYRVRYPEKIPDDPEEVRAPDILKGFDARGPDSSSNEPQQEDDGTPW